MLSGSALLRVAILVAAAAGLAALVQVFWPTSRIEPEADGGVQAPTVASRPAPQEPVRPAPSPSTPLPPAPLPSPRVEVPPPAPAPVPAPAPNPAPVAEAPLPQPAPTLRPGAGAEAPVPAALSVVDLNTATLAELNGLQGGGAIGRAIVRARPYTSVDQLLSKRVLSKATYQRIKDQVTVR